MATPFILLKSRLADHAHFRLWVEVMLSYSIGLPRSVSLIVKTSGTGKRSDRELTELVGDRFDFRLAAILKKFRLRHLPSENPDGFYRDLAAKGNFGRTEMNLPWEKTDMVEIFRRGDSGIWGFGDSGIWGTCPCLHETSEKPICATVCGKRVEDRVKMIENCYPRRACHGPGRRRSLCMFDKDCRGYVESIGEKSGF